MSLQKKSGLWLIFNSDGRLTCSADHEPDADDLALRDEAAKYYSADEADDVLSAVMAGALLLADGLTPPPPSQYHAWDGIKWVVEDESALLADLKDIKLKTLNAQAQAFINQHTGLDALPDFEVQTWPLQSAEAQAWAADNSAATPVLDRIAAARGMEPDKLKAAALRKALAYSALSAHVAGQRQALQSKIESAKTVAALDKIKIEFTAPEAT